MLAAKIINDIISICSEDIFQFDEKSMFVFKHTFRSSDCHLTIKDNRIQFLSARQLTLEPADIVHLDFILHTRTAIHHEILQNDKLPIVAAPNVIADVVLSIIGLPLFNASNQTLIIQPGTVLFSLTFQCRMQILKQIWENKQAGESSSTDLLTDVDLSYGVWQQYEDTTLENIFIRLCTTQ